MASFPHVAETGTRFNGGQLAAPGMPWVSAPNTSVAEVAHHLRREAIFRRLPELRDQYRSYTARLAGNYTDIRNMQVARPEL